jgi:hypothetical protein
VRGVRPVDAARGHRGGVLRAARREHRHEAHGADRAAARAAASAGSSTLRAIYPTRRCTARGTPCRAGTAASCRRDSTGLSTATRALFGMNLLFDNSQIRARNPRFLMPHFGQKTGFRARMTEIKSGIPCSVSNGALFGTNPVVGNSPLNLDESPTPTGLGNLILILMQSSGTGRYCSDNSPTFQTTFGLRKSFGKGNEMCDTDSESRVWGA